jgi:hypothetical protein
MDHKEVGKAELECVLQECEDQRVRERPAPSKGGLSDRVLLLRCKECVLFTRKGINEDRDSRCG